MAGGRAVTISDLNNTIIVAYRKCEQTKLSVKDISNYLYVFYLYFGKLITIKVGVSGGEERVGNRDCTQSVHKEQLYLMFSERQPVKLMNKRATRQNIFATLFMILSRVL